MNTQPLNGVGLRIHSIASLPFRGDGVTSGVIYHRLQQLIDGDWTRGHVIREALTPADQPTAIARMTIEAGAQVDMEAVSVPDAPGQVLFKVTLPLTLYLTPQEAGFLVDGVYATVQPEPAPPMTDAQASAVSALVADAQVIRAGTPEHQAILDEQAQRAADEATAFERLAKLNAEEDEELDEELVYGNDPEQG